MRGRKNGKQRAGGQQSFEDLKDGERGAASQRGETSPLVQI